MAISYASSDIAPGPACKIGVVIVNYGTPALVIACVRSIAQSLERADARIVIVDNASPGASVQELSEFIDKQPCGGRISLIAAPHNGGFSAGNNLGVAALNARYYFLLNSDAAAAPGALDALASAAGEGGDIGVIAPRILGASGAREVSLFRNHSLLSEFVDGAQSGPITRLFKRAQVPIFPEEKAPPQWVSFAAVMISAKAVRAVGPMDEGFFLYYEDCDYCRRICDAGFEIKLAPQAAIYHEPGGSTQLREKSGRGERLPGYYYASRMRYFRKYYGPAGPVLANLAWYAGRAIAKIRGLFGRAAPCVCDGRARDMWIGWRGGQ